MFAGWEGRARGCHGSRWIIHVRTQRARRRQRKQGHFLPHTNHFLGQSSDGGILYWQCVVDVLQGDGGVAGPMGAKVSDGMFFLLLFPVFRGQRSWSWEYVGKIKDQKRLGVKTWCKVNTSQLSDSSKRRQRPYYDMQQQYFNLKNDTVECNNSSVVSGVHLWLSGLTLCRATLGQLDPRESLVSLGDRWAILCVLNTTNDILCTAYLMCNDVCSCSRAVLVSLGQKERRETSGVYRWVLTP